MSPSPTATAQALGPLFAGPAHGIPWSAVLPILIAVPAIALLVVALVRGRLPAALVSAGVLLPVAAYAFGSFYLLEASKRTTFCGSCHVMTPILASLSIKDSGLAATHYLRGRVPHDEACYTCHSGYGIWGGVDAKKAGIMHMVRTVTERYALPITLNGPFDINSCLNCHAETAVFRDVVAHQNEELQKQLLERKMSCTGICHPPAHPTWALNGKMPSS